MLTYRRTVTWQLIQTLTVTCSLQCSATLSILGYQLSALAIAGFY